MDIFIRVQLFHQRCLLHSVADIARCRMQKRMPTTLLREPPVQD